MTDKDNTELEAEKLEAEKLEAEKLEAEKLEAEKLEAEKLEAEKLEAEKLEAYNVIKDYEFSVKGKKVSLKKGEIIKAPDVSKIFINKDIFNYMMKCTKLKDCLTVFKQPINIKIKKNIKDKKGNVIKSGTIIDLKTLMKKVSKISLKKFREEKRIMEIKNVQD